MGYSNDVVAENFLDQTGKRQNGNTCSYYGDVMRSYATAIAKVDVENNTVLVSRDGMTSTTSKTRCAILYNAHSKHMNIVSVSIVPNYYYGRRGDYYFPDHDKIMDNFFTDLEYYSKYFNLSKNRIEFQHETDDLLKYLEYYTETQGKKLSREHRTILNRIKKLNNKLIDIEFIKSVQREHRQGKEKVYLNLTTKKKEQVEQVA